MMAKIIFVGFFYFAIFFMNFVGLLHCHLKNAMFLLPDGEIRMKKCDVCKNLSISFTPYYFLLHLIIIFVTRFYDCKG